MLFRGLLKVQSLPTEVRGVTGPADAAKPQWSQVMQFEAMKSDRCHGCLDMGDICQNQKKKHGEKHNRTSNLCFWKGWKMKLNSALRVELC